LTVASQSAEPATCGDRDDETRAAGALRIVSSSVSSGASLATKKSHAQGDKTALGEVLSDEARRPVSVDPRHLEVQQDRVRAEP
jgi:hypothetical protein